MRVVAGLTLREFTTSPSAYIPYGGLSSYDVLVDILLNPRIQVSTAAPAGI